MTSDTGTQIIEKARSLGASLAGIASVRLLKVSPSYQLHEKIEKGIGVGDEEGFADLTELKWPENAESALVVALSHPKDMLELDWVLESGNTPGNWHLQKIIMTLSEWVEEKYKIKTHKINYYIEEGGLYLKDLAVLAGLGCIGKNNLLITPEFGPRVRLRAMLLDAELTPSDPIDFDPCERCEAFCRKVCPENAFDEQVLSPDKTGMSVLPARNGFFSKPKCFVRSGICQKESGIDFYEGFWSEATEWRGVEGTHETQKHMESCRRCDLACPVGA